MPFPAQIEGITASDFHNAFMGEGVGGTGGEGNDLSWRLVTSRACYLIILFNIGDSLLNNPIIIFKNNMR